MRIQIQIIAILLYANPFFFLLLLFFGFLFSVRP